MLVSCIMPTRGRRQLARTAIQCFLSQTWEDRELLILDDEDDPSFGIPPGLSVHVKRGNMTVVGDPQVRYYGATKKLTIGAKREILCREAGGKVIIHFDSDDWSAPDRITEQVELLQRSGKPMSGYHSLLFWDMRGGTGYQWNGPKGFAVGTSMAYTKEFWRSHHWPEYAGLPGSPRLDGTDVEIVRAAQREGGVETLDGRQMCIARAHDDNTSTAKRIATVGWPRVQDAAFPDAFFAALSLEQLRAAA